MHAMPPPSHVKAQNCPATPSPTPTLNVRVIVDAAGGKLKATYEKLQSDSDLNDVTVSHDPSNYSALIPGYIDGAKYTCGPFIIHFVIDGGTAGSLGFDGKNPMDAIYADGTQWDNKCKAHSRTETAQIASVKVKTVDHNNDTLHVIYNNFRFDKNMNLLYHTLYRLRLNDNGVQICLDPDPIITNGDGPIKIYRHHKHHHLHRHY